MDYEITEDTFTDGGIDTGPHGEDRRVSVVDLVLAVEVTVFDEVLTLGEIRLIVRKYRLSGRPVDTLRVVLQRESANGDVGQPAAGLAGLAWTRLAALRPEPVDG